MSSILKALRKIEEEKRGGKLEAPDLRSDQGRPVVTRKPLIPLVVGIVFGVVVAGLFFLWSGGFRQDRNVVSEVTRPPVAPVTSQAPPVQQVIVGKQMAPETIAKTLQQAAPLTPVKSEAPVESTANELPASRIVREPIPAPKVVHRPVKHAKPQNPPDAGEPATPTGAAAEPELPANNLTLPEGIELIVTEVFYKDAVNSMAVVNDLPVMVGSHVDSAVVTEIHADRVLFEVDGKVYSVPALLP